MGDVSSGSSREIIFPLPLCEKSAYMEGAA